MLVLLTIRQWVVVACGVGGGGGGGSNTLVLSCLPAWAGASKLPVKSLFMKEIFVCYEGVNEKGPGSLYAANDLESGTVSYIYIFMALFPWCAFYNL